MESALIYPDDIITDDPGSKSVHPTSTGYEKMANVWYNEISYVIDNLLGTDPPPSNTNLVINGDFESGNLNGWYTNNAFGGAVYTFDLNSSNAIAGTNDARLNITSPGSAKLAVVKEVKNLLGVGLKDAKDLVDGAPAVIKEGVAKAEAESIKAALEAAGAQVELK